MILSSNISSKNVFCSKIDFLCYLYIQTLLSYAKVISRSIRKYLSKKEIYKYGLFIKNYKNSSLNEYLIKEKSMG